VFLTSTLTCLSALVASLKAICLSIALAGQMSLAMSTGSISHRVRTSHVITHMEASGVHIPWQPIDVYGNLAATMSATEYRLYEAQVAAFGNTTVLFPASPLAARSFAQVYCYGSGAWALDATLIGVAGRICEGIAWGVSEGSVQLLALYFDATGRRLVTEAGDPMGVFVEFAKGQAAGFTKDTCNEVVKNLSSKYCQGKHA
jgi:hypothetical protein